MPVSFHLLFFISFGAEVTKISCHFQAKRVQLTFSFFVIYEKRKWDETLITLINFQSRNPFGWHFGRKDDLINSF